MRKLRQAGPIVTHSPFEMYCRDWQTRSAVGDGEEVASLLAIAEGMQYPWMSSVPPWQVLHEASGL